MQWILQIPVLFFSIIFHEFAHGYSAYMRGDDTAYLSGRLTFNPLPHIDLFGTIILPFMSAMAHLPMIGWAKPVPVNQYRMRNPHSDMAFVAASGPLSNMLLAFSGAVLFKIAVVSGLFRLQAAAPAVYMLQFFVYINIALALFNLLPIYPLDGGQIVYNLLPYRYMEKYERIMPYGFYIVIFFVVTGLIKYWIIYPMGWILNLFALIGLPV